MTSSSHPASPAAGYRTHVADWVDVSATARNLRAAYLGSLLRNAVAALTPGHHRAR